MVSRSTLHWVAYSICIYVFTSSSSRPPAFQDSYVCIRFSQARGKAVSRLPEYSEILANGSNACCEKVSLHKTVQLYYLYVFTQSFFSKVSTKTLKEKDFSSLLTQRNFIGICTLCTLYTTIFHIVLGCIQLQERIMIIVNAFLLRLEQIRAKN